VVVPSRLDHDDVELLRAYKERHRETAQVRSSATAASNNGGGLFSRLRETFTGR
jgi:molecular chaperone DnaJ